MGANFCQSTHQKYLVIWEMQIKATQIPSYPCHASYQENDNRCWRAFGERGASFTIMGGQTDTVTMDIGMIFSPQKRKNKAST